MVELLDFVDLLLICAIARLIAHVAGGMSDARYLSCSQVALPLGLQRPILPQRLIMASRLTVCGATIGSQYGVMPDTEVCG